MSASQDFLPHFLNARKLFDSLDVTKTNKGGEAIENFCISGMESVAGLFDDIHLLKSFGIISESNYVYRKLNKSGFCSKVWLLSLVLSTRKCIRDLNNLWMSRSRLRKEEVHFTMHSSNSLRRALSDKIALKIKDVNRRLILVALEIMQNIAYLIIVAADVFTLNLVERWKNLLEKCSSLLTVLKFLFLSIYPV